MTRYTYPHTIENGAGERITFARQGAGPAGDRLEGENVDVAFLTTRFRSEYAVLEIPPAVQRIVFPVFVAVGRLLGRYARYADAPRPCPVEPRRRRLTRRSRGRSRELRVRLR